MKHSSSRRPSMSGSMLHEWRWTDLRTHKGAVVQCRVVVFESRVLQVNCAALHPSLVFMLLPRGLRVVGAGTRRHACLTASHRVKPPKPNRRATIRAGPRPSLRDSARGSVVCRGPRLARGRALMEPRTLGHNEQSPLFIHFSEKGSGELPAHCTMLPDDGTMRLGQ
jgi:hypothetical protein